ncbi:MAG TPA: hypothetical protein VLZ74_15110 [Methylocella sp.]|nr:hypothetical protein [Methylocella sp.]
MKRFSIFAAIAMCGAVLLGSSPASARCWYAGGWHRCGWHPVDYSYWYGYPYYGYYYGYPYGYGYGLGLAALATAPLTLAADATAPLVTGRSVAASGSYCATPVRTCLLREPGWVGTGCSCRVYGGHARGLVE